MHVELGSDRIGIDVVCCTPRPPQRVVNMKSVKNASFSTVKPNVNYKNVIVSTVHTNEVMSAHCIILVLLSYGGDCSCITSFS